MANSSILINDVLVFNGCNKDVFRANIFVEDSLIRKISEQDIIVPEDTLVIDGKGKFLMPGLIDAHWHTFMSSNTMIDLLTADSAYTQIKAIKEAENTLLRGFTTVRDAGGPVFGIKRAIDEQILPGPRIYPCGAIISQTGGHGDFRAVYEEPRPFDCCKLSHTEEIGAAIIADGVDAVTVAARNNIRLGASQIKLMTGGGVASLYDQLEDTQFFEEEIRAAVKAAEDVGTYVMVHVYVPRAIKRAVLAGVKSIEHGHLIDEPTMEFMAQKGTWLSMQPFTYNDNQYPSKAQQDKHKIVVDGTDHTYNLAKKYQVKLAWGTDLLFNPMNTKNQNQGILKLQKWFTNYEILRMITYDNAQLLSLSGSRNPYPGKLGIIEENVWADMIILDGNAMDNIDLLGDPGKNILLIMKGGEIFKNIL